ncbi:hypothetical protein PSACC_01145 [Paramicrosporidium saccamoebae]|uniref:HIG1 domain-containing protein n=1 Tax=Paramicrosporidium saccamoebae TaxID=1246581 RepID=A0A2H9TMU4_9FUNG|nr:hypothetical protein PSACC_01145 [Paramicrosporidium saccamoebae]
MEPTEQRNKRLEEEQARSDTAYKVSRNGFLRGASYGLAGGLGLSLLLSRFLATFGAGTFASEHAVYRLTRPAANQERSTTQAIVDHRLAIFGTAVSAAVLGTGYKVMQNSNTTGAQKFMNVRLYGQMAGLAAVMLMMGLTAARKTVPDEMRKEKK